MGRHVQEGWGAAWLTLYDQKGWVRTDAGEGEPGGIADNWRMTPSLVPLLTGIQSTHLGVAPVQTAAGLPLFFPLRRPRLRWLGWVACLAPTPPGQQLPFLLS